MNNKPEDIPAEGLCVPVWEEHLVHLAEDPWGELARGAVLQEALVPLSDRLLIVPVEQPCNGHL